MQNNIVKYRKQKGFNQAELAEKIGITRQALLNIEKDKCDPSLKTAITLCKVLNRDLFELFPDETYVKRAF